MKSAFLASLVLLATTAGAALAGEPMVLTNAQLDRVTAGVARPAAFPAVVAGTGSSAVPADRVFFRYNHFNNAVSGGGGIWNSAGTIVLTHSTIAD